MKEGIELKDIKKRMEEKPDSDVKDKILKDIDKKTKHETVRK